MNKLHFILACVGLFQISAQANILMVGDAPVATASLTLAAGNTATYATFNDVQVGDVLVLAVSSNRTIVPELDVNQLPTGQYLYEHTFSTSGTAGVSAVGAVNTEQIHYADNNFSGQSWIWWVTVEDVSGGASVSVRLSHDGSANSSTHYAAYQLRDDGGNPIQLANTGGFSYKETTAAGASPYSITFDNFLGSGIGILSASAQNSATITTPTSALQPNDIHDAGWVRATGTSARGQYYDITSIAGAGEAFNFELETAGTLALAGAVFTAVPEPSAFALLAGIAGLGGVLYRRHRYSN